MMFSVSRRSFIAQSIHSRRLPKLLASFSSPPLSFSPSPRKPSTLSISQLSRISSLSTRHAFSVSIRNSNSSAALRARTDVGEVPEPEAHEASDRPATQPFSSIESHVSPALYRAITQSPFGYSHMSVVQDQLLSDLPNLIQDTAGGKSSTKDLLVKAKTGTGKTLAFLIPAIESRIRDLEAEKLRFKTHNPDASQQQFILHMRRYEAESTGILVLSPTRELATQIAQEAIKLTSHLKQFGIRLFVGGASKSVQLREFERGRRDIVVATPGRLNDVLNSCPLVHNNLSTTKTLILDEADTLLEMGFKEEIDKIVQQLPPKEERSTYLFSATISNEINRIAQQTMKKDTKIVDCVPSGETNVHAHVPQYYTILPNPDQQIKHIFNLIAHDQLINPSGKTILFLPTTKMTQMFSQLIGSFRRHLPWNSSALTKVYEMHGGRTQRERENIAQDFKAGSGGGYQILVTSDVSARGVDYPGVTRVIQIGVPTTRDIYVHRVGRTGRAGKAGRGDLVLLPFEEGYILSSLREIPIKPLPVSSLNDELSQMISKIDGSGQSPVTQQISHQRMMMSDRNSRQRFGSRGNEFQPMGKSQEVSMQLPIMSRVETFETNLKENIIPSIGEDSIRECFGSLLGYYTSKASDLRTTKDSILTGLKQWSVAGMLLTEEPYVSPTFLQKLGFNSDRKPSRFGGNSRGGGGGSQWGRAGGYQSGRGGGNNWGRGGSYSQGRNGGGGGGGGSYSQGRASGGGYSRGHAGGFGGGYSQGRNGGGGGGYSQGRNGTPRGGRENSQFGGQKFRSFE